eukprot:CAMPEP_0172556254 /NCGR_PEP_ID=MMETSP1067-20121228/64701_1 /TAXON_ID=265564 ORGANISM="Thalassiosira punctigera, Strain Tpunct2005C2" /NCGR_SAMPLE_ID=MMETSP1067 /ASSEMBLY_ACC=CAM_ASM_000444 /LENGTH=72 /DNA_ID=CAMNT_0013345009 /DNA_START=1 /DNA_END=216 /DNA_ORIENTATION=-
MAEEPRECSWLRALAEGSDEIEMSVLDAMTPSRSLSAVVDSTFAALKNALKRSNLDLSGGTCLHHRNGPDWH